MIRRIITINEDACNGCGLCADACHEGAIGIVGGKAKLLREDYCDGLGDCLPACPMNAISFEEREAPAYDEAAVLAAKKAKEGRDAAVSGGCPGAACRSMEAKTLEPGMQVPGCLTNFPVQIKLAPVNSPFFSGAHLLIAADCAAYAYGNFHQDFIRGRVTLIGCPKLDNANYAMKLAEIIGANDIQSVTVARMTVPCCGGLSHAVQMAVDLSGKDIPVQIVTISPDGQMIR